MKVQFPRDVWNIGADSEVVFGSTLVPEDRNPTEFSIAAMPGMFICAYIDDATHGMTNSNNPARNERLLLLFIHLLAVWHSTHNFEMHHQRGQLRATI